jgi:hypothetical protein
MNLKQAQIKAKSDFQKVYGKEIKAGRFIPVGIVKNFISNRIRLYCSTP